MGVERVDWEEVCWAEPGSKVGTHFTVHEALWLPSWRVYHIPTEEEKKNICDLAYSMSLVREYVGRPIIVHCWIRPIAVNCIEESYQGKNYNLFVGSTSKKSSHIFGRGIDWHAAGMAGPKNCAYVRESLLPKLEEFGLRMEDISGGWIHNDSMPVIHNRFYRP